MADATTITYPGTGLFHSCKGSSFAEQIQGHPKTQHKL